jgi:hypothetical protein
LVTGDAGLCVEIDSASANQLTIPDNATQPFAIGTTIMVRQMGAGSTTIGATAGVTVRKPRTLVLTAQYATASLHKRDTDEWCVDGNLT